MAMSDAPDLVVAISGNLNMGVDVAVDIPTALVEARVPDGTVVHVILRIAEIDEPRGSDLMWKLTTPNRRLTKCPVRQAASDKEEEAERVEQVEARFKVITGGKDE